MRAIETAEPSVALVLPCNVALDELDGGTRVRVVDPQELIDDPGLSDLAGEASGALRSALARLYAHTSE